MNLPSVHFEERSESICSTATTNISIPRQRRNTSYNVVSSNYESWEYEVCENEILKEEERKAGMLHWIKLEFLRWMLMLCIGAFTGLFACALQIIIEQLTAIKFDFISREIDRCEDGGCVLLPLLYWVLINSSLAILASSIVVYAEVLAGGSGVPQLKCYLNGIRVPRLFRLRTLVLKTVAVLSSILAGLAVGKEPAITHCGATVGDGLPQGRIPSLGINTRLNYFRSGRERRDFVSVGAAVGVAAAFGAPFGGLLFCLEETASFWNQRLTWRMFLGSLVTVFVINAVLSFYYGRGGELSYDDIFHFGVFKSLTYNIVEIPIFIGMGVIGGLLGALYNCVYLKAILVKRQYFTSKYPKVIEAGLAGGVTACIAMAMIYISNECSKAGPEGLEHVPKFYCPSGSYPSMAVLWFQTPLVKVRTIFHDGDDVYSIYNLFFFAAFYLMLSCWTMGLSTGSGLYLPCFLIGGVWGRIVAKGVAYLFPTVNWLGAGKYAVIGGAAQLGGILRMTICFTAILVEGTGNLTLALPIMITLNVAKWVGDMFNEGFYDLQIRLQGIPLLPQEAPPQSLDIVAKDIMSSPVISLSAKESVGRIIQLLKIRKFSGFPVVFPENERVQGVILRSQLLVMLKYKLYEETQISWNQSTSSLMFEEVLKLNDFEIPKSDWEQLLDLSRFMNPHPYTVHEDCSLPRLFNLFRGMGLRRLVVVHGENKVKGIITRIELAKFRTEKKGWGVELSAVESSTIK